MEANTMNLPVQIAPRVKGGTVTWGWPVFMLLGRTLLFLCTGLIMVTAFAATGSQDPWAAAVPWWPYQVIATNVLVYSLLRFLARREGLELKHLVGYRPDLVKKDLLQAAALLIPIFVVGSIGLYGASFLIWGTMPPETMFQPLPLVAALVATVVFPLTNAMVETTTYMGYSLPRLEALTNHRWVPLLLAASGLAVQHVAFPLVLDGKFLLWRLVAFLPLALVVGLLYMRMRRLVPILIVHYLMDLQLVIMVLMASLPR